MLVRIVLLFMFGGSALASAEVRDLRLDATASIHDPLPVIDIYRDTSGQRSIEDAQALPYADLDGPLSFGYTPDKIWLRFGVSNPAADEIEWVLRTHVRFMRPLEVFIDRGEGPRRLLYNDEHSTFGMRPEGIRHLAVAFSLAANERATFYIRVGAGGSLSLPMEITTRTEIVREQWQTAAGSFVFVAILATLALVNLFHFVAVRANAYWLYGLQAMAFGTYVLHMEGFTFQYLWPNAPGWNSIASPVLGNLCHFTALLFAVAFLRSREFTPHIYRWLVVFVAISGALVLASFVLSSRLTNQMGLVMVAIAAIVTVANAIVVLMRGNLSAAYYLLGWSVMASAVLYFSAGMLSLIPDFGLSPLSVMKIGMVGEALALALGLADQHRRLTRRHADTQAELVLTLQQRLDDARELVLLEQERERINTELNERSRRLATTTHDINQPVQSLRLVLGRLADRIGDPEVASQLDQTLADVSDILNDALERSRGELRNGDAFTPLVVGPLLTGISEELEESAARRGKRIRAFDSQLVLRAPRIPLKRCLANLAANAIAHGGSEILLGARRRGSEVELQVIDNGTGIDASQLGDLTGLFSKGDHSHGYGIGLAIVTEISDRLGWKFRLNSTPGRGSTFSISIPLRES